MKHSRGPNAKQGQNIKCVLKLVVAFFIPPLDFPGTRDGTETRFVLRKENSIRHTKEIEKGMNIFGAGIGEKRTQSLSFPFLRE